MKYLPIVIMMLAVGCKNESYPKFVHNTCTNEWAIITGWGYAVTDYDGGFRDEILLLGGRKKGNTYLGTFTSWDVTSSYPVCFNRFINNKPDPIDIITDAKLGHELTFDDSLSAVAFYKQFTRKAFVLDSITKIDLARTDSQNIANKKYKDSIFNCQHNYK